MNKGWTGLAKGQMQQMLSGRQKAAILLITLGPEVSAQVFKHLREEEIEQLTLEIANVRKIDSSEKEAIMAEFHQIAVAQEFLTQGGINYAKEILEKALGTSKAMDIINRLTATLQVRPFDFARKADAAQILNFIQNENGQTIALVLSYLTPEQASIILSSLPQEKQADVAKRIALMDSTSPEVISQVERVLEQKLSATVTQDYTSAGGIEAIVQILNGVDRGTERTILDSLEIQDPELAEEIKKRMFVFEDIVNLDNRSIQRIIRDIENADLQLALKVASEEVRDAIFRNMSKRMADTFREEMEFMGPVRLRDVEEAQTRIVATVRRLEEAGEIIIARGGGDDIIV
jgi:flagellar motor switch protein FliG